MWRSVLVALLLTLTGCAGSPSLPPAPAPATQAYSDPEVEEALSPKGFLLLVCGQPVYIVDFKSSPSKYFPVEGYPEEAFRRDLPRVELMQPSTQFYKDHGGCEPKIRT